MKILAIRIKNLASLGGETEIDFTAEPLCSIGIFAITGATGAGKSTILDALCLALYAKTPRYLNAEFGVDITDAQGNTTKQNDIRRILRDGTAEGFAEVDFVATNGQPYRSRWSVRRSRGKADGNLQPDEMSLRELNGNQPVPGRKTELLAEIERLVGLTFEQFTRSVLLAQGDFTAFLKADKNQKASLLEKLTGSEIYSRISAQIFENHKAEKQKLDILDARRNDILTYSEEELADIGHQKTELEAVHRSLAKTVQDLTLEKNWHRQFSLLTKSANEAKARVEKANRSRNESLSREKMLEQVISVQPAKQMANDLEKAAGYLAEKETEEKEYSESLLKRKETKKVAVGRKEQAANNLMQQEQEWEAAQPKLRQASELDVRLKETENQKQSAQQEAGHASSTLQQHEKEVAVKTGEAESLKKEINQIENWIAANKNRESIAVNESLILEKLENAASFQQLLQESFTKMEEAAKTAKQQRENHSLLIAKEKEFQSAIDELQPVSDALKESVLSVPIDELENEKLRADQSVMDLISAEAHWRRLHEAMEDNRQLLLNHTEAKASLQSIETDFAAAGNWLEKRKTEKENSFKILEKAKIAATGNVETLREQLVASEPCPVCGSVTHPYKTENPQLHSVLQSLEENYREAEFAHAQQNNTHIRLEQQLKQWQDAMAAYEKEIPLKTDLLNRLNAEWKQFPFSEKAKEIPVEEVASRLFHEKEQKKNQQSELQQMISAYGKQKKQFDEKAARLTSLKNEWSEISNRIKDIERDIKSAETDFNRSEKEHQHARNNITKTREALSIHFTVEDWFTNWQKNPEKFIRSISEFTSNWKKNTDSLAEKIRMYGIRKATVDALDKQSEQLRADASAKKEKFDNLQAHRNEISEKRNAIFKGKAVDDVENELKQSVATAKTVLKEKEREVTEMEKSIAELEAKLEQTVRDKTKWRNDWEALKGEIDGWINEYNRHTRAELTTNSLKHLLGFGANWIEAERSELQKLRDAVTNSQSAFAERQKDVAAHLEQRISEKEAGEVENLLSEAESKTREIAEKISSLKFDLQEDEKKRQQIAGLLKEMNRQRSITDDWAKLNELIGSADGKKFRQIAQEFTLDALLGYANVHLGVLNRRYLLQRASGSLGLQVVDQDMGNEVRTVYSLSGGESFFVKLAQALGFASLSSHQIQVETLFIDEGFGSLDSNTLNIAMDALERLHNQGRKVGVISHVPEMTERIPVQIHVSKQQSGKSKVEVLGLI
ncbi:MAG: AAA family ATPase [Bacteroidia bacterium]|nr:AAA family ATPase [Bacteroidia bacterium]